MGRKCKSEITDRSVHETGGPGRRIQEAVTVIDLPCPGE